jgi:hypothetical protein
VGVDEHQAPGRARADPIAEAATALVDEPPARAPCPTGLGWCITCATHGAYTVAHDPVAGSHSHLRTRAGATA